MGIFSNFFRRVGGRPVARHAVVPVEGRRKGWGYIEPVKPEPKTMQVINRSAKSLTKKAKKVKRRNATRQMRGRMARQYLADMPVR